MDSIKTYVIVWLSGVAAGLIVVERWRRAGARGVPAATGDAVEAADARPTADQRLHQPKAAVLIVTGARADVQRARRALGQVLPWGNRSDASLLHIKRFVRARTP